MYTEPKIAQLILKNLYCTENTLSGTWFCELLSDLSKTCFGFQDHVSGHKVKTRGPEGPEALT